MGCTQQKGADVYGRIGQECGPREWVSLMDSKESSTNVLSPGGSVRPIARSVRFRAPAKEYVYSPEPEDVVVEHEEGEPIGGELVDARRLQGLQHLAEAQLLASIDPGGPIARFNARNVGSALVVGTVVLQTCTSATSTSLCIGRWCWKVELKQKPGVGPEFGFPGVDAERLGPFLSLRYIWPFHAVDRWNWTNPIGVRPNDCVAAVDGVFVGSWPADRSVDKLLHASGDRQEWVVVRAPGGKYAAAVCQTVQNIGMSLRSRSSKASKLDAMDPASTATAPTESSIDLEEWVA